MDLTENNQYEWSDWFSKPKSPSAAEKQARQPRSRPEQAPAAAENSAAEKPAPAAGRKTRPADRSLPTGLRPDGPCRTGRCWTRRGPGRAAPRRRQNVNRSRTSRPRTGQSQPRTGQSRCGERRGGTDPLGADHQQARRGATGRYPAPAGSVPHTAATGSAHTGPAPDAAAARSPVHPGGKPAAAPQEPDRRSAPVGAARGGGFTPAGRRRAEHANAGRRAAMAGPGHGGAEPVGQRADRRPPGQHARGRASTAQACRPGGSRCPGGQGGPGQEEQIGREGRHCRPRRPSQSGGDVQDAGSGVWRRNGHAAHAEAPGRTRPTARRLRSRRALRSTAGARAKTAHRLSPPMS